MCLGCQRVQPPQLQPTAGMLGGPPPRHQRARHAPSDFDHGFDHDLLIDIIYRHWRCERGVIASPRRDSYEGGGGGESAQQTRICHSKFDQLELKLTSSRPQTPRLQTLLEANLAVGTDAIHAPTSHTSTARSPSSPTCAADTSGPALGVQQGQGRRPGPCARGGVHTWVPGLYAPCSVRQFASLGFVCWRSHGNIESQTGWVCCKLAPRVAALAVEWRRAHTSQAMQGQAWATWPDRRVRRILASAGPMGRGY
eukprot:COSAG04_NODE_751_length_10585_cov_8.084970_5_plen_254_part_00